MSLLVPRWLPPHRTIADDELVDRIKFGDPSKGWEGDPNMDLVLASDDSGAWWWELWTLDAENKPSLVLTSNHYVKLGPHLIDLIVQHDTRKVDVVGNLERHNEAVRKAHEANFDAQLEEVADKLTHALRKDGVHRHA